MVVILIPSPAVLFDRVADILRLCGAVALCCCGGCVAVVVSYGEEHEDEECNHCHHQQTSAADTLTVLAGLTGQAEGDS